MFNAYKSAGIFKWHISFKIKMIFDHGFKTLRQIQ